MINTVAVGLVLGLIALGVLFALGVGIKNVINGKSDLKRAIVMVVPVIVFGIAYAIFETLNQAGVATMVFMLGLMALGIIISSTRRTFNL